MSDAPGGGPAADDPGGPPTGDGPAGGASVIRPDGVVLPGGPDASDDAGSGADGNAIDPSRLRSFIGLSLGLVGPRANLAVSGVLITLFVQHRAAGALAVTFALTANRLLSIITYPVAGRLSDRTKSRVGRRTPYMGISLIVMGVSTYLFTETRGYWVLVLLILIARQAASVFTLTNIAVVPEVFGRSRWLKAVVLTTVLGYAVAIVIKAIVVTSWKTNDPSTWNAPFQFAGVVMAVLGIAVLVLVRESKAAAAGAAADRGSRARPISEELRTILALPNAKVLVTGSLLFWSGVGSTAYVAILFFQDVVHAGASAQTIAGLFTGIPALFIGVLLGIPLSRVLTRRQLAIGAPLLGGVLAGIQYFDTHIWQAVVLAFIGAPFIGAYVIVLAPYLLQLLPRSGGLGERLGVLLAPFNLCAVVMAYIAAAVVDATGNYRLIWLFPAATGLCHGIVNCWLRFPVRRQKQADVVQRIWQWAFVEAESMLAKGLVAGVLAAPLIGQVTKEDAYSAVVVDLARQILGNPYEDEDEVEDEDPSGSSADGDGERGVAGVIQVGGGPVGELLGADQKSGLGVGGGEASSSASDPDDPEDPEDPDDPDDPEDPEDADGGGVAAVPAGGVASSDGTDDGAGSGKTDDVEASDAPDSSDPSG